MIVFDMDGTLSDCSHRRHLIASKTQKDWEAFHREAKYDIPIYEAIELLKLMQKHYRIGIWTCRPETIRQDTVRWLNNKDVFGISELRMRAADDFRPDYIIKEEWLKESVYKPELVFEDRTRVVQMWRSNSIPCYQVSDGDF